MAGGDDSFQLISISRLAKSVQNAILSISKTVNFTFSGRTPNKAVKGLGSIVVVKISEKLLKIISQNLNNLEQAQKEWSRDAGSTPQRGQVGSKSGNILLSCTLDQWIRCTTLNWISLCLELTEEECILFKTAFQVSFSNLILKSSSQRDFNDLLDGFFCYLLYYKHLIWHPQYIYTDVKCPPKYH